MNNFENKKVSIPLAIGIFLIPLIFAWFTLRKGYSKTARMISFGWLILGFVAFALMPTPPASKPAVDEEITKNTAPAIEPKAEKVGDVKTEPVVEKVETNLGITPEQFRKKFNAQLKKHDISFIRPLGEFDINQGDVRDSFLVQFSDDLGMTGTVNKDGMLREVLFIMTNSNETENPVPNMLIVTATTSNILNSKNTKDGADTLIDLIKKSMEGMETKENTHSKVIGDVKYYAIASPEMGLWVGFSPKDD